MFVFDQPTVMTNGLALAGLIVVVSWLWQVLAELTTAEDRLMRLSLPVKSIAYSAVIIGVLIASSAPPRAFIYFQF